ncbi:MAG: aminoglycoside phosphotransferase family protein [Nocardioidaceae bacterium]
MTVATTHDLTFSEHTVTKRYRRWSNGEPQREWEALTLIHANAPHLVPAPLSWELDAEPPHIVMSRLPGEPVGSRSAVSDACLDAVAHAVDSFHHVLPTATLDASSPRRWGPTTAVDEVRSWAVETLAMPLDRRHSPEVRRALTDGVAWITSSDVRRLESREPHVVFGRGDGNVANLLWDGHQVRLVDFEDAGVSDRSFELADLAEHVSTWVAAGVDVDRLLDRFTLTARDRARVTQYRRLFGLFWLLMLLPGNPAAWRNPDGTLDRQAARLSALLGSV